MNKYVRATLVIPLGTFKLVWTKLFHPRGFIFSFKSMISPLTEITIERRAVLQLGTKFRMRSGAKIRIRKRAKCIIGDNVAIGHGNLIACHDIIKIGNNVLFSPNVLIYDHDHDFRCKMDIFKHYKTAPIEIGNNVWIGANTVVLRGTKIGDNCVVGAGCIIKGNYPSNTIIIQKRKEYCKLYEVENE